VKQLLCFSILVLVVLAFAGVAIGGSADDANMQAKNDKKYSNQSNDALDIQSTPVKTKEKLKIRYCRPALNWHCQKVCGDVSPSKPSGSKWWGRPCNPKTLAKCETCGFLD
jgi:hypothetical protein